MKNSRFSLIIAFAALAFCSGCTHDSITGPSGPAGTDGTNGNVNVSVQTYTVTSWLNDGYVWYTLFNDSDITFDAQKSGSVQVFMSRNGGITYAALPFTQKAAVDYFMTFATEEDLVQVQWTYDSTGVGINPNAYYKATCSFKIVVIPPQLEDKNVDVYNYEAVKAAYKLND